MFKIKIPFWFYQGFYVFSMVWIAASGMYYMHKAFQGLLCGTSLLFFILTTAWLFTNTLNLFEERKKHGKHTPKKVPKL